MVDKHQCHHPSGLSATKFEKPDVPLQPVRFDQKTGQIIRSDGTKSPADRLDLSYSKRKKKAKKSSKENKRRPSDQQASTPIHTPLAGSSRLNQQPTQLSTTGYYGSPSLFQEAPAKKDRDHQDRGTGYELEQEEQVSPRMQNPTMPRKLDHQTSAFMDRGVLQHLEDKSQRKKK